MPTAVAVLSATLCFLSTTASFAGEKEIEKLRARSSRNGGTLQRARRTSERLSFLRSGWPHVCDYHLGKSRKSTRRGADRRRASKALWHNDIVKHFALAGIGQDNEFVGQVTADRTAFGDHRDRAQAHAGERAQVSDD
jgi:hypothetical protein